MHVPYRWRRTALVVLLLSIILVASIPTGLRVWGAYHHRAARLALQQRDYRQAREHLRKYLELRPDEAEGWLLAARMARLRGDFDEAQKHLRTCRQRSGSPKALALEHQLLRVQQGDLSDADTLLARCADHAEDPETAPILEAVIEGSLKVEQQAFVREMVSQGREHLVDIRRTERAVDLWLRQRPERVDQVQGLVWRGLVRSLARDYPASLSCFRRALALDPDHFEARLNLAYLLLEEAPEEAANHLERLRQQQPDNNRVRFRLATVRRSLGQLQEARQLLTEILASTPEDGSALLERGKVALDERKLAEAERWLRRAVEQAPNLPEANLALSQCLNQAGKTAEAKQFQERFDRLHGGVPGQTAPADFRRKP